MYSPLKKCSVSISLECMFGFQTSADITVLNSQAFYMYCIGFSRAKFRRRSPMVCVVFDDI